MFQPAVSNQDINSVVSLAQQIWPEHYTAIIGQQQVDYMLAHFHSTEIIAQQIHDENYRYFVIQHQGNSVGYFAVQVRAKALFLSKLYLLASMRGKGLGRQALAFIVKLGNELALTEITLTVNKYNHGSIAAYEKFGFIKTGEICVDIGQNYVMDDYEMAYSLNS
ncbi:GNAT family N-acetyltransferase [Thalassotalea sp. PLHSN55]|uniref:GNAT family N-acetyltransferase n=1 Tax=Thalassotalea sp. PLHSN55 TaxID=3435888 RepID=UPI003F87114C